MNYFSQLLQNFLKRNLFNLSIQNTLPIFFKKQVRGLLKKVFLKEFSLHFIQDQCNKNLQKIFITSWLHLSFSLYLYELLYTIVLCICR